MRTIHTLPEETLSLISKEVPLFPHQEQAIAFVSAHNRCLLADEAGLGKSRVVIETAKTCIGRRQLLVICPASLVPNWVTQVKLWKLPEKKVTIISYDKLLIYLKDIIKGRYGMIAIDEAHYIKNWKAQRTKNVKTILKGRDSKTVFLTGTPIVNGAMDLHTILSLCEPGEWGKYGEFCERYCQKKLNKWKPEGVDYFGVRNIHELKNRMGHLMLRRFKKDVLNDLPPKIVSKIPLQLENKFLNAFMDNKTIEAAIRAVEQQSNKDETLAETLKELGLQKVPLVKAFVNDTFPDKPVVIFGNHRIVLESLKDSFEDSGYTTGIIWGKQTNSERYDTIGAFQEGKIDRLMVNIHAGGVGVDMHRSSHCVFAEFPWTQAAIDQAIDRLHRIGQQDCVNAYYLYAQYTFEEPMLKAIERKLTYMEQIVGYDRQTDDT